MLPPGHVEIVVVKNGFAPASASVDLVTNQQQTIVVELNRGASVEEHVTVSATRTDRGIEDQPMRVEVVDAEEIEEKAMMTPGDVVMLLNETGGMRVQATSPSLGAASIRIQGMRGRYTRFLSDGLPLFGEQVSLGLMQIPPLDLGRVEVIKGVASSLYGAGAMSGVVNLVSKRPDTKPERQILLNASTRGATDAGLWYSTPLSGQWGFTLLGSANGQARADVNGDGWSDLPRYERAVARPRVFWDNHAGRSFFATVGGTWENRTGGTIPGMSLPATGGPYIEALDTRRADVGSAFQALTANGFMLSARMSWSIQHQDHQFGEITERDDHDTGFAEITVQTRHRTSHPRRRRGHRARSFSAHRYAAVRLYLHDARCVRSRRCRCGAVVRVVGQRPSRPSQRVRNVSEPAHFRPASPRTVVEPPLLRDRLFRAHADHRRDRGRGPVTAVGRGSDQSRARHEHIGRSHACRGSIVGDADRVLLARRRSG